MRFPTYLFISFLLLPLSGCRVNQPITGTTQCQSAIAEATYTWQVEYFTSRTSGGLNARRFEEFASTRLTNYNREKPVNAVTGPDDYGVWWPALPPRPSPDEVADRRQPGEQYLPPELQRRVKYQLKCEAGQFTTDAQTYRETAKQFQAGKTAEIRYFMGQVFTVD